MGAAGRVDVLAVAVLLAVALAVRFPELWIQPAMTDEWREAGRALQIARGQLLPLTNYDTFIGALWNYVLAAAYSIAGTDLRVPRLVVMLVGALTVVPTYLLGRELGGRVAGWVAGLLLATAPVHVLVNSHIAWSNSTSPLFTTTACWLLAAAIRRGSGPRLALSGLAFGLAFQTHPTTFALVPGALVYLWLRGRRLARSRWLLLAAALFVVGSLNLVVSAASQPGTFLSNPSQEGSANRLPVRRVTTVDGYATNLGYLGLTLVRLPSGVELETLDPLQVLAHPLVWLYAVTLGCAALFTARRGEPLAVCLLGSAVLLLAFFQPSSYLPVPEGRYAMPMLPPLYATLGAALVMLGWQHVRALAVGGVLAAIPLFSLWMFYRAHAEESAGFAAVWPSLIEVERVGQAGTPVLIDRALEQRLDSFAQQTTLWPLWNAGLDAEFARIVLTPPAPPNALFVLSCATYPDARARLGLVPLGSDPPEICNGSRAARSP